MGADLEPRGGVGGELRVGEESGEDGRDFGPVLCEPIALQYADRGRRGGVVGFGFGEERDFREVGESEGVDWGLLGVEVFGDGGVEFRTTYYGY